MDKYVILRKIKNSDSFGYELAVCSVSDGQIIKTFGDDTVNEFIIANTFCQENGYIIVNNNTVDNYLTVNKSSTIKRPTTEKTITIGQLLEAYKDYALEQIRGGEADIDMLDKFFNDYLHIDTTEAYESALETNRKNCDG